VANTIQQFLSGLNLTIALMVYTSGSINLDAAVNTAKSIEAGYNITQKNIQQQSNHTLQQETLIKDNMKVLTATLEKLLH